MTKDARRKAAAREYQAAHPGMPYAQALRESNAQFEKRKTELRAEMEDRRARQNES